MLKRFLCMVVVYGFFPPCASLCAEETILNIASYHPDYEWTATCVRGIQFVLDPKYNVVHHYMDTKHLLPSQHAQAAEKAWQVYLSLNPALVMLGDDNALKFFGPRLAQKNIPTVFYGINANPRIYFADKKVPKNIAGVLERPLFIPLLGTIKKLLPNPKNILILFDDSITSKGIADTSLKNKNRIDIFGLKAYSRNIGYFDQWKKAIQTAPDKFDAIILATLFTIKDSNAKVMDHLQVLEWTSANTQIPLFGVLAFMTSEKGAVGSLVIVGEKHGQIAAEIADKILMNQPHKAIAMDKEGTFFFNKTQMKRFNISLPKEVMHLTVFN